MMIDALPGLPGDDRTRDHGSDGMDSAGMLDAAFRAHAPALRGRLIGLTRDPAAADDLLGESFLRLATEIDAGRAPLEPAAWLYRVGRNLAISRARRTAVATRAMPGLLDRGVAASPEDAVIDRERDELLYDALAIAGGRRPPDRRPGRPGLPAGGDRRDDRLLRRRDPDSPVPRPWPPTIAPGDGRDDRLMLRLELVERPRRRRRRGAYHRAVVDDVRGQAFIGRSAELGRLAEAYRSRCRRRLMDGRRGRRGGDRQDAARRRLRRNGRGGGRPSHDRRLPAARRRRAAVRAIRRGPARPVPGRRPRGVAGAARSESGGARPPDARGQVGGGSTVDRGSLRPRARDTTGSRTGSRRSGCSSSSSACWSVWRASRRSS